MRWMPRVRMLLARRPWIYWISVAVIAFAIGSSVRASTAAAKRERETWGITSRAVIADRRIEAGEPLEGAVSTRPLPIAMLPASALVALPLAATARHTIAAGEVLVSLDVTADKGALSLLPDGWLAIVIDDDNAALFTVGDTVAVVAAGRVLTPNAVVVQLVEGGVVVGLSSDVVGAVAEAANQRVATVALSASP